MGYVLADPSLEHQIILARKHSLSPVTGRTYVSCNCWRKSGHHDGPTVTRGFDYWAWYENPTNHLTPFNVKEYGRDGQRREGI